MAKSKSRKVAPKKNRIAIKDPGQKGGVRMINADAAGRTLPTEKQDRDKVVKSTEPRVLTQTERSAQEDIDDIGSLDPRSEEGPTANKKRRGKRALQQEDIKEIPVGSGPGLGLAKDSSGKKVVRPNKQDISPVRFGVTAEAVATAADSGGGTGASSRPNISLDEADGRIRRVRKSTPRRGSFGAPDALAADGLPQVGGVVKRTEGNIRRGRRRAAGRTGPTRTGTMDYNQLSDINIAESRDAKTQEGITSLREGITSQNLSTKRPVEKMTASERHIHFATQARAADVAATTANRTTRQFRSESKAGRTAFRGDVAKAVEAGHITKDEAQDLRSDRKYGYAPSIPATLSDTRAALNQTKGGKTKKRGTAKIEHDDAMNISPEYAAEHITPSLDKYMMSDASMHHEVGHYLGVRPSVVKSFVSKIPVGPGKARRPDSSAPATPAEGNFSSVPMKEFRDKIVNAVRGEGMQTSWVATGDAKTPWKPVNWHPKGAIRVRSRQKDGSNMTVTKNVPSQAPQGSISHLDYMKMQLANHAESSPSMATTTRKRDVHPVTNPIVTAAMATSDPRTPPKGRGGSYLSSTVDSDAFAVSGGPVPSEGTVVKPEKFTPTKRPRRRAE
jgi:hypothetical protein